MVKTGELLRSLLRIKGSQPHTGLLRLDHQCWKEDSPQHLAVEIIRGSVQVRPRTYWLVDSLILNTSAGAAA